MVTALHPKGRIVLPASVRKQLNLLPGDRFEIVVGDDETIILRRALHPANRGLIDLLLACPEAIEIPRRATDDTKALLK